MRKPSLTRQSRTVDGRAINTYECLGREFDIYDSAFNAIHVQRLFADAALTPEEKSYIFPRMIIVDQEQFAELKPAEIGEVLITVAWDAFGLDIAKDGRYATECEEAVFDFDEDAGRIRASLLQCFGIDWDTACRTMSYSDLCSYLNMALESGEDTPFSQAIHYRTAKPPTRDKYNRDMCEHFEVCRKHFALKGKGEPCTANDAAAGMFAAAKRAAQGGE